MFNKKKEAPKPNLPKEYVWALDIDGEDHEFKCLVTEDEVITYEDGVESKHLKIMDHTCQVGVLQIDCNTKLFKELVGFQLERYIPYLNLAGGWAMSDTTRDDRMAEQIQIYKNQSKWEIITGIVIILVHLLGQLLFPVLEELWILSIFGIFFIASAFYRMARLRNELMALEEAKAELEENEKEMKAYLEDKTPVFHKAEEE